jgi:hypothetical protein
MKNIINKKNNKNNIFLPKVAESYVHALDIFPPQPMLLEMIVESIPYPINVRFHFE